ncbi:MAG TPA: hypothetical protein VJS15_05165, partial [Allosphingosinicella sp.]|nr:hypothetical protein [Allosphingosinicella sp.]
MRTLGFVPLTALILTGLPPAPIEPVLAQSGARTVSPVQSEDPDARCRPFLEGFRNDYAAGAGYGRSGISQPMRRPAINPPMMNAPPSPPPPSP